MPSAPTLVVIQNPNIGMLKPPKPPIPGGLKPIIAPAETAPVNQFAVKVSVVVPAFVLFPPITAGVLDTTSSGGLVQAASPCAAAPGVCTPTKARKNSPATAGVPEVIVIVWCVVASILVPRAKGS